MSPVQQLHRTPQVRPDRAHPTSHQPQTETGIININQCNWFTTHHHILPIDTSRRHTLIIKDEKGEPSPQAASNVSCLCKSRPCTWRGRRTQPLRQALGEATASATGAGPAQQRLNNVIQTKFNTNCPTHRLAIHERHVNPTYHKNDPHKQHARQLPTKRCKAPKAQLDMWPTAPACHRWTEKLLQDLAHRWTILR